MTTPPIYEYRIYCVTESAWKSYYGPTAPTVCPTDTTHTINPQSAQELQLIGPNATVSTDSAPVDAHFQLKTIKMLIPAVSVVPAIVTKTMTFPYNTYIWELSVANAAINITDELSIGLGTDTAIGGLTASVAAGATVIPVSSTVFDYSRRGDEIAITDGTNIDRPGIIVAMDKTAGTITTEFPLANAYGPGSGLLFTIYVVRNYVFSNGDSLNLGRKGLQSKLIPAGVQVKFTYVDNTPSTQDYNLYFHMQYYHN